MSAREDPRGALLLLEEQDRSLWDTKRIHLGLSWLADAARGDTYSRYHAEAAIAAEHCLAPSVAETRWDKIEQSYAFLETIAPSAMIAGVGGGVRGLEIGGIANVDRGDMLGIRRRIYQAFSRRAVVVGTELGRLHVARHARTDGFEVGVFLDKDEALAWLRREAGH